MINSLSLRPWLWLPSQWGHDLSSWVLPPLAAVGGTHDIAVQHDGFRFGPCQFRNRLGLAGGFDKKAQLITAMYQLGAGFVEIGTITPRPQRPNPGKILSRSIHHQALWNRMGFPNPGAAAVAKRLVSAKKPNFPVFANIGKNRETQIDHAAKDYISCMEQLAAHVDGFVVNISSPNTEDLRSLGQPHLFKSFIEELQQSRIVIEERISRRLLLLIKLSPDEAEADFKAIIEIAAATPVDGFVLTNTHKLLTPNFGLPANGGLSGKPLRPMSLTALKWATAALGQRKQQFLLISVGGIFDAAAVNESLAAGADLIEVYSALVFHGPWWFQNTVNDLQLTARAAI